jgi:hypothetical protein
MKKKLLVLKAMMFLGMSAFLFLKGSDYFTLDQSVLTLLATLCFIFFLLRSFEFYQVYCAILRDK